MVVFSLKAFSSYLAVLTTALVFCAASATTTLERDGGLRINNENLVEDTTTTAAAAAAATTAADFKKAILESVYQSHNNNYYNNKRRSASGGSTRRSRRNGRNNSVVGTRRQLEDTQTCDIGVEITKCTATIVGGTFRSAPTSFDCDQLNDVSGIGCFCDIDVEYEYAVTNNADEPKTMGYLLKRTGGFYNGKDDEDLSVDIKFLSEAFNTVGGVGRRLSEDGDPEGRVPWPMCNSESVLIDSPFDDGVEDTILAPGQSITVTSSTYSVNVCTCPTFVFGAAATASQVSSSSSSKKGGGTGKKGQDLTFFEFECAAADAVRFDLFDFRRKRGDEIDGRC